MANIGQTASSASVSAKSGIGKGVAALAYWDYPDNHSPICIENVLIRLKLED